MANKVDLLTEPEEDLEEADEEYADQIAEETAAQDLEEEEERRPQPRNRPTPNQVSRPQPRPTQKIQVAQPPKAAPVEENEYEVREIATATQPVILSKANQGTLEIYGALATILNKLSRIEKNIFG